MLRQGQGLGFELQVLAFATMATLLFSGKALLEYWVYREPALVGVQSLGGGAWRSG